MVNCGIKLNNVSYLWTTGISWIMQPLVSKQSILYMFLFLVQTLIGFVQPWHWWHLVHIAEGWLLRATSHRHRYGSKPATWIMSWHGWMIKSATCPNNKHRHRAIFKTPNLFITTWGNVFVQFYPPHYGSGSCDGLRQGTDSCRSSNELLMRFIGNYDNSWTFALTSVGVVL